MLKKFQSSNVKKYCKPSLEKNLSGVTDCSVIDLCTIGCMVLSCGYCTSPEVLTQCAEWVPATIYKCILSGPQFHKVFAHKS